jgi:hypothetical protein
LTCLSCPSVCNSCINATNCKTCIDGYYLYADNAQCLQTCPSRYYGNDVLNTCEACVYPCLTCTSNL